MFNEDWAGKQYHASPFGDGLSDDLSDLPHDHIAGTIQAAGENGGFIKATETYDEYTSKKKTSDLRKRQVMGYYPYKSLPVFH